LIKKGRMGIRPYGRLGGTKTHRGNIIVHNVENFKILSHLRENVKNASVMDGLGILRLSVFLCTKDVTAILPL